LLILFLFDLEDAAFLSNLDLGNLGIRNSLCRKGNLYRVTFAKTPLAAIGKLL
jgi:hypothetical protein